MAPGRGGQRESVRRIQAHRRSISAELYLRLARRRFSTAVSGQGRAQAADLLVALELRVLGMDIDRLPAVLRRQLHRPIKHQKALLRVEGGSNSAAAALRQREVHLLARSRHSCLLVKGEPAGLYVNLTRRSRLGGCGQRLALDFVAHPLARRRLGSNRRRHGQPHQRDLNRPSGFGRAALLVVFKLIALDAIHAAAVFAVEFNLHIVEQYAAALVLGQLDQLRCMNLVERMPAQRMSVGPAVGLLLDVNAHPLRQIAPVEGIFPLAYGKKGHQRPNQQDSRR